LKLTYAKVKKLVEDNNKSGVSTELLICLIWKETNFDADLKNSKSTATGLMQVTVAAVADVNANTPKGIHFEHSDMKDPAKNIQCGSYYLGLRIKRMKDNIAAGLNGFGTGPGYADDILKCETCLQKAPPDPQKCLDAIHT
jgi:soluble lytic murein transglycosylase-like protein